MRKWLSPHLDPGEGVPIPPGSPSPLKLSEGILFSSRGGGFIENDCVRMHVNWKEKGCYKNFIFHNS
jgi:hypothetical protein